MVLELPNTGILRRPGPGRAPTPPGSPSNPRPSRPSTSRLAKPRALKDVMAHGPSGSVAPRTQAASRLDQPQRTTEATERATAARDRDGPPRQRSTQQPRRLQRTALPTPSRTASHQRNGRQSTKTPPPKPCRPRPVHEPDSPAPHGLNNRRGQDSWSRLVFDQFPSITPIRSRPCGWLCCVQGRRRRSRSDATEERP